MKKRIIYWFRRDLRLHDNSGLYHALKTGVPVQCIFIFDKNILNKLDNKQDARVTFIHRQIEQLHQQLHALGSGLITFYATPEQAFKEMIKSGDVKAVYANHDYEPYAIKRDLEIGLLLQNNDVGFHTFKDQVIFEKDEIVKDDGKPYTVFTPYKNKWLKTRKEFHVKSYPTEKYHAHFIKTKNKPLHTLKEIGFKPASISFPESNTGKNLLINYGKTRDIPSLPGTSRLSIHFRFGTISIRKAASVAIATGSDVWLNELIWRDFYQMILWHFPHVAERAFKPAYNHIPWRNNEKEFQAWCEGQTGYPIVDAGMRELNATGFMHNRVRMITASFLVKHLLIDWKWGEAYFAAKLLDFDLSANNGGWQWAASSGCDAAPYFRIFNPSEQTKKFDPQFKYIRKWVPEFEQLTYPSPIVDHKFARERCLATYKKALGNTADAG
ncbi:MAG: deoxyribodipyrimidine photo-lyase [Bacteroidetes bacterium]|nr:deoxyribodipyrimidine photo-lyase [Bacteroidota bacterium]